ncbi:MAG TPA: class I SAM-dependent methyltransferase [Streptosporangiaceae bacterium]|nr:class I SAM-dependent methyltransferase [Streptosporangiaceae bacterium]
MAINTGKLQEFLARFVADLGATVAAGNVVIGHRLGLYQALAAGPAGAGELAARTQTSPRYIAEWLCGQAAGGYVEYDPATGTYSMTEEQAYALANPDGGVYAPGAFVLALGALKAEPRITEAFRTGGGIGWHEHDEDVFLGCEQFFRPGYTANLVPSWTPALDGVHDKLRAGARVADIGCGLGASTILLAREYPNSAFTGSDYHDQSIEIARKRAGDAGVADRVTFEVATAAAFSGTGYDLAATACTTWVTRSPPPATSARRSPPTARGSSSSPTPATRSPATSPPSAAPTTTSPPSSASPTPCPKPAATRSEPKPARPPSGSSSPMPASPGSAAQPKHPSTSSTRPAHRPEP